MSSVLKVAKSHISGLAHVKHLNRRAFFNRRGIKGIFVPAAVLNRAFAVARSAR